MTSQKLLDELRVEGCEPTVVGFALTFLVDPPERLVPYLEVLHTGVRAILTGKRWHAFDPDTGRACGPFPARGHGPLAYGALDPSRLLPPNVGFLCVESDPCWDRLPPFARMESPGLFDLCVAGDRAGRPLGDHHQCWHARGRKSSTIKWV